MDQLTAREREVFGTRLTERELEVFGQLASGRDRSGIARVLGVSPHTVRTHIQKIFIKLDVHSMIEALALLRAIGLGSAARPGTPQLRLSSPEIRSSPA